MNFAFIEEFKRKRCCLLRDESSAPAQAVLCAPAETAAAPFVNSILALSGGLLFVAVTAEQAEAFGLTLMSRSIQPGQTINSAKQLWGSCVSVDARAGTTTGISVHDRVATLHTLASSEPHPRKLLQPGHVFPIRCERGGLLVRNALPVAALDLVLAAGYAPAALVIDLLDSEGNALSSAALDQLARTRDWPVFSLSQVVQFRLATERLISRVADAKLPSRLGGDLRAVMYKSRLHEGEHLALVKGTIDPQAVVLTRVQTEATFTDVFGGNSCSSRQLIQEALHQIGAAPAGVFLFLRKPAAGHLQRQVESLASAREQDSPNLLREYGIGAQILNDLGVRRIELLTGSTKAVAGLQAFGIEIVSQRLLSQPS